MNRCGQCISWKYISGCDYDYCTEKDDEVDEYDKACEQFIPRTK